MKQVDNLSMEEFTLSTSSINENISLKSNNKSNPNSYREHEEIETRSCPQRTCGPMGPGSMRGCIFNLCILSLGTGALALPQKIGYMSLLFSPIVIFVSGTINYWTLNILGDVALKHKIRKYEEVFSKLFNEK